MRWVGFCVLAFLVACSTEKKLTAACEKGDPGACDVLSARYAYGDGVEKDEARSRQMREHAMELCQDAGAESMITCVHYPKAIPLDMPKSASSGEIATVFSVVLAADGTTAVDGKTVPNDDAVLPFAKSAHEHNPELRAVIKADTNVPHGRVIHMLDLLKQAGVTKIAFGVSPAPAISK